MPPGLTIPIIPPPQPSKVAGATTQWRAALSDHGYLYRVGGGCLSSYSLLCGWGFNQGQHSLHPPLYPAAPTGTTPDPWRAAPYSWWDPSGGIRLQKNIGVPPLVPYLPPGLTHQTPCQSSPSTSAGVWGGTAALWWLVPPAWVVPDRGGPPENFRQGSPLLCLGCPLG